MTDYHWATLRDQFTRATGGDIPGAQLEQDIITMFEQHPAVVAQSMKHVKTAHKNGKIISPWAVLRKQIEHEITTENITASDSGDKTKAIKRAETWMRHSGIHYDRESEIILELFDRGGILEPFAGDPQLEQRMTALWREARPTGEAIEQADREADALFAERHKCQRCGKLRPFLLKPCPHCQFTERLAAVLATIDPEPTTEAPPEEEPL